MSKSFMTSVMFLLAISLSAQKVIETPTFKGTTADYVKITKIELHDTATVIGFEVHFKPNWWIQVPKETWIQDSRGGEKLYVKSASGIEIDERHTTPKNGINEYTLYFPPVGEDVKSIDFMEVKWKIFGIELAPEERFSIFPDELLGNWLRTDGSNEWVYGFYDDMVIYDSEIWKQVLINSEGDTYQVLLQKDGKRKKLLVKQQDDKLLIGPNESGLELFSRELTSNPDYAIPNDEAFQLPVFKKDTAWYKGYIKGYDPRMGETGMVYVNNILSTGQESYLVTINNDGSFSAEIPMLYPQMLYVRFLRINENIFFEPGKTTFQFFDFSRYHDDEGFENLFMGTNAKINTDLAGMKNIRYYDSRDMQEKVLDMSPEEYKAYNLEIKRKEQDALEENIQKNPVCKKAQQIENMQIAFSNAQNILSYNMKRTSAYRTKHKVPRDQREIPLERVELSKEYYEFIDSDELNNPLSVIAGGDYYFLINRVKYADALRPKDKISVNFWEKIFEGFEKRGIKLEGSEKILIDEISKCETDEERSKLAMEDSVTYNEISRKYKNVIREIAMEFSTKKREETRQKGLGELFNLESGFALDIMKAQDVSQQMKSRYQPLDDGQIENLRSDIGNSFIVDYLLSKSKELETEIAEKKEAFENKSGFVVNETPDANGGDLFDTIMKKYEGSLVFVDFWATWCGPCRSGMQRIKPLKEELKDKNIRFVYITNPTSPKSTWEIMIPDIDGEHYYLTQDEWNKMAARFKVSGISHYVLVGKDGSVLKDKVYFASSNTELKKMFEENLK
jgi:thiol-disulfide isomerase/thioredoxin